MVHQQLDRRAMLPLLILPILLPRQSSASPGRRRGRALLIKVHEQQRLVPHGREEVVLPYEVENVRFS
jgi:hypothetical protein